MNLFLNSTQDAQTVTFLTNSEVCALGRDYCNSDPSVANQLPIDPHTHEIATGLVTIHNGIHLLLHGEMTIANLVTIQGTFTFTFEANPFVIQVTADASIGLVGIGNLASATVVFRIDGDGLELGVNLSVGAGFGSGIGLSFSANATMTFSTAGFTKHIDLGNGSVFDIAPGFLLSINGSINFIGIVSATGSVTIAISANAFTIQFDVDIALGPLDLQASGFAGVYTASGHSGLVLQLDVSINFDLFDIIKITGNGQIRLNTTPDTHVANGVTMNAHSFRLHIDGQVSLLDVIKLTTSVDVVVGGDVPMVGGSGDTQYDETVAEGQWFFLFTGSANFFGIATLNASGWVDSKGHFGVDLNGGITIGSSSFGLSGSFDVHAWLNELPCSTGPQYCNGVSTGGTYYTFGVAFSAEVDVNAFGFSLASVGIGARITASGTGTVDLVASVHFHISFLFFSFSATASFDIGTVQLPKPIYLAGDAGAGGFSVGESSWQANDTPLYLNMGDRAAAVPGQFQGRGLGDDQPNESFDDRPRLGVVADRREDPGDRVRPLADRSRT